MPDAQLESPYLWSPSQLQSTLATDAVHILDVRLGEDYAMGHLPGAIHFSTYALNTYDTDPAPLRSFTHMWAFLLAQRGLTPAQTVVVCGQQTDMNAARAFWFLEYLGYPRVYVLDGGIDAWQRDGGRITQTAQSPKATHCEYTVQPDLVATHADVTSAICDADTLIIDTRSRAEWLAEDARAKRNGSVPGAIHQDWRHHLRTDGRMRTQEQLRQLFSDCGAFEHRRVIAFCNTGYRSAHAYLALRGLGHANVRNYIGSWQEWGNRDGCAVVVPNPEDEIASPARLQIPHHER